MADSIVSFSGLASGIQWRDLVDQIMVAESTPITRLQQQITLAKNRTTVWADFRTRVQALKDAVAGLESGEKIRQFTTSIGGVPAGTLPPIASATADSSASVGTHSVTVLGLATAESLGSSVFASRTTALGLSGAMRINGRTFQVAANDTLDSLAQRLNGISGGTGGTGVTASVLAIGNGSYRLVLSSAKTGAAGIELADAGSGVVEALGFADGTVAVKSFTSNGARSDAFADASATLATVLGLSTPPAAADVTIGSFAVNIDLSAMSLDDVAAAINTAAGTAGSAVTATVVDDTTGAVTKKRLEIHGTTSFADANHILESIGVLEAGHAAVAQEIKGGVITAGNGTTPATAATSLLNLWSGGAAANVQAGDTLTLGGTRGDGSRFTFDYTVTGADTVQDVLDRLNSAVDGYQAGTRTATASIDATGRITVTDSVGGASRLALSIVAHNQGGGTLDTGAFSVTTVGIARQISAGADAEVEIDGTYFTSASNTITNTVPGLTFNLQTASASPITLSIGRDVEGSASAVKTFVDAYNSLTTFVTTQLTPPPEGGTAQPLYGDGVLRSMRSTLRLAMNSVIASDIASGLTRLPDLGIEIQKDGKFKLDDAKLKAALVADGDAVARLFGLHGVADNPAVSYLFAGDATKPGTYAVDITQAAQAALHTGIGFAGTYVDDATPDSIIVKDLSTGKQYTIQLSNGMSVAEIVDIMNAEFGLPKAQSVQATNPMYGDAIGTAATDATTFASLFDGGGTSYGVATGDVLTISGSRADGSAFSSAFQVADASITTLGDLRASVQSLVGSDADVAFVNGQLTVTSKKTGASLLDLAITSDNAGGGTLGFGAFNVAVDGRGVAAITASDAGGQLSLSHNSYGSAQGFEISFAAGGADGTASLGLIAGTYNGVDVIGTIGGLAATGVGRVLTGGAGTAVDGLAIEYSGAATGAVGNLTFSRGIASVVRIATDPILGTAAGSISAITDRLGTTQNRINERITTLEDRLDVRRESLVRRFTAMEQVLARAQQQSEWLAAQINQFPTNRSTRQ